MVVPAMQLASKIPDMSVQLWSSALLRGKSSGQPPSGPGGGQRCRALGSGRPWAPLAPWPPVRAGRWVLEGQGGTPSSGSHYPCLPLSVGMGLLPHY